MVRTVMKDPYCKVTATVEFSQTQLAKPEDGEAVFETQPGETLSTLY